MDAMDGEYVMVGHTGTLHVGTTFGFGTGLGYHLVGRHAGLWYEASVEDGPERLGSPVAAGTLSSTSILLIAGLWVT
jgi:hypothetical protein